MAVVGRKIGNGPGVNRKVLRQRMCDNYTIINLEMHESTNIQWSRQHINVFLGYVK